MNKDPILARYGNWTDQFTAQIQNIVSEFADPDQETELCAVMKRQGSDKGGDRHNYTKAYHSLLKGWKDDPIRIFEVGLGTNNEDVRSSMGPAGIPGASLRGWREFFPRATIYGADIDRRILFQDDRIHTYYIDQLKKQTIEDVWAEIGDETFDLVLDDGLHTFEANSTFTTYSFHRVKPGGFLIIEDIIRHDLNLMLFDAFLRSFRSGAVLLDLPHRTNTIDNIIAVIAA